MPYFRVLTKQKTMKASNSVLINQAKESLKGKWGLAFGGYVIYYLISTLTSSIPKVGLLVAFVIEGPFLMGIKTLSLSIARNKEGKIDQIFEGFKSFAKAIGAFLLMILYIALWTCLLIVPGIIAVFSYSMTFFILIDEPSINISGALEKSKKLMEDNKMKYFWLFFRFASVPILISITLDVIPAFKPIKRHFDYGSFLNFHTPTGNYIDVAIYVLFSWLFIWMYVASAKFYDDIKPKEVAVEIEW